LYILGLICEQTNAKPLKNAWTDPYNKHHIEKFTKAWLRRKLKKKEMITPERRRIAKIFKTYTEKAIDELGPGYTVDLQGNFYATSIRIVIEIFPIST